MGIICIGEPTGVRRGEEKGDGRMMMIEVFYMNI
jgi:hypothetical protein